MLWRFGVLSTCKRQTCLSIQQVMHHLEKVASYGNGLGTAPEDRTLRTKPALPLSGNEHILCLVSLRCINNKLIMSDPLPASLSLSQRSSHTPNYSLSLLCDKKACHAVAFWLSPSPWELQDNFVVLPSIYLHDPWHIG